MWHAFSKSIFDHTLTNKPQYRCLHIIIHICTYSRPEFWIKQMFLYKQIKLFQLLLSILIIPVIQIINFCSKYNYRLCFNIHLFKKVIISYYMLICSKFRAKMCTFVYSLYIRNFKFSISTQNFLFLNIVYFIF